MMNAHPMLSKVQIDVRRLPAFYAHKKIRLALKERELDIKLEKDRKLRTSLTDHLLFAIVCDSKKVEKQPAVEGEKQQEALLVEEEVIDWAQQETIADAERREEEEQELELQHGEEQKQDGAEQRRDPYDKTLPFAGDQVLLIHRLLKVKNYEYIFFVNESGTRDIGVFLVLIDTLNYKSLGPPQK
ncbi:hypothetical protein FGO68_gene8921 [Halteria grandinella]|uniref:Uncharacterized protein n=1 Tax=Halteria grandinella TaxID=5974 RepID=A0A8J8T6S2_HALGN|nr:hypothetical protein FGO68_gene8921 [Halteria grandinella]